MGFSTPEDVERLIWPTRDKAPLSVSITPIFVIEVEGWPAGQEKPPTGHAQRVIFELTGVASFLSGRWTRYSRSG
jgi:hypothetical protein